MKNIVLSREKRIHTMIILFIAGLTISGLTAIPVHWEASLLKDWFGSGS